MRDVHSVANRVLLLSIAPKDKVVVFVPVERNENRLQSMDLGSSKGGKPPGFPHQSEPRNSNCSFFTRSC